jgi:cell wall-associated NlpC family hydrolase
MYFIGVICLLFSLTTSLLADQQALICVPVADLVGSPLNTRIGAFGKTITEQYAQLPYSDAATNKISACPRIHQLLFNETVMVVGLYEHQACITIPQAFYITHHNKSPQNLYWTLKKNLMVLSDIQTKDAAHHLPDAIDFSTLKTHCAQPIVSLIHPWHHPASKKTFSAGTRFIFDPAESTADHYCIALLNPRTKKFDHEHIPTNLCHEQAQNPPAHTRQEFLKILKNWAHQDSKPIPYVWGGCSYCMRLNENEFNENALSLLPYGTLTFYTRPSVKNQIKTGFDCAGLIARAAQLCGMPYFYKNTLTLSHYLHELGPHDQLEEGDLIWIPGHVMVVSSLKNNLLIEARSYLHGYGIVHEIPLSDEFKDMQTYADLVSAFRTKKTLIRLDKGKNEVEKIKNFKVLKLSSIWPSA